MPSSAALVAALLLAVSMPALSGCAASPAATDALPSNSPVSGSRLASPGAPGSREPVGPRLVFPRDVHLVFDYADTGDATKDALLHDWEAGQRVFNAAETLADPTFKLLGRYEAGNALASAVRTLRTKRQQRQTVIGTRRFYRVTAQLGKSLGRVTWCVDDSQFFARNVATGKAVVHHGPGDYYRVQGTLQHDPRANIWVLTEVISEVGVRC
jgi:hypothetical protein